MINMTRAVAVATCLAATPVGAATYRVDDYASIPRETSVGMRWRQPAPGTPPHDLTAVDGATAVQLRLNLSPWVYRAVTRASKRLRYLCGMQAGKGKSENEV